MPAYCTLQDIESTSLPPEAIEGINPKTVTRIIEAVSAEADTYLAQRYTLPLSEVDPALRQHVANRCALQLAISQGLDTMSAEGEVLTRIAASSLAFFRDIAKGLASLSITAAVPPVDTDLAEVFSSEEIGAVTDRV